MGSHEEPSERPSRWGIGAKVMAMFSSWLIVIGCSVGGEKPRVTQGETNSSTSDVSAPSVAVASAAEAETGYDGYDG